VFNRKLLGKYTAKLLYKWEGEEIQTEILKKVRRKLTAIEKKLIRKN